MSVDSFLHLHPLSYVDLNLIFFDFDEVFHIEGVAIR
jgi:hypothetical protein